MLFLSKPRAKTLLEKIKAVIPTKTSQLTNDSGLVKGSGIKTIAVSSSAPTVDDKTVLTIVLKE